MSATRSIWLGSLLSVRREDYPRIASSCAVQNHALHLSFAYIIIDGHRAIPGEHRQLLPLAERVELRLLGRRIVTQHAAMLVTREPADPLQFFPVVTIPTLTVRASEERTAAAEASYGGSSELFMNYRIRPR